MSPARREGRKVVGGGVNGGQGAEKTVAILLHRERITRGGEIQLIMRPQGGYREGRRGHYVALRRVISISKLEMGHWDQKE